MGNIRSPKPKYFQNGVVNFYVMNKVIYFKVWLWLKDGLKQFELTRGKYESDQQIDEIIIKALFTQQSFTSVENQ